VVVVNITCSLCGPMFVNEISFSLLFSAIWSEFLAIDPEARVQFPALPEKKSSGSGTGSSQPREYN
jgi:hypothetical protein